MTFAEGPERGVREVKSAARTVDVLEVLAAQSGRPMRLQELAEHLAVPRSSLYALLQTLVDRGWVRCDETGSLYQIGIRALLAGTSYLDYEPRLLTVRPILESVAHELGETIHFARLDRADIVYLFTRESRHYLRRLSRVGRRLPAHCTAMGKALLAEQPRRYLESNLPRPLTSLTPKSITDTRHLVAELDEIRQAGYAVDHEENVEGLICFGFALHYDRPPIDAFSCSVPISRLDGSREKQIIETMQHARREIEMIRMEIL